MIDITKVLIARDLSPSVQVLLETFAESDEIGVKVTARFDLALAHQQAVTLLTLGKLTCDRTAGSAGRRPDLPALWQ